MPCVSEDWPEVGVALREDEREGANGVGERYTVDPSLSHLTGRVR